MKRYKDTFGNIAIQISDVETITRDWNCDGDIYPMTGIWIEWEIDGNRDFISIYHLEDHFTEI